MTNQAKENIFRFIIISIAISLIIIGLSGISKAQTVSFSPYSMKAWGSVQGTMKATLEYENIEAVVLYAGKTSYHTLNGEDKGTYSGYRFGLFYTPITVEWSGFTAKAGGGFWNKKFPTPQGEYLHFTAQLSYHISDTFSIEYTHYSNGFGLLNPLNDGLDNIGVSFHF